MTVVPKILLIDDDELDRKAFLRELRNYNREIECIEATTSEESITALSNDTFDAVLLDFHLAGETGLEVLKALNARDFLQIPVIMLSGMEDEDLILECLENGAQDYLLKNELDAKTLLRSIRYAKERKQLLEQVTALAKFDPLTGLANRSRFNECLENALLRAQRRNDMLAVLYIDLDHFKDINDTLGHGIGDALLINVGRRFKQAVRKTDVVARLGGDEFAIIAENIKTTRNAVLIAEKIIALLSTPQKIDGYAISISPSIGIAIFPECGSSIDAVVRSADTAMYHAKKQGRNNYQFFDPLMHKHVAEKLAIENGLRQAIARNELEVYYQPQIDVSTNKPVAMEALLRWDNAALGKISPGRFIPIAEDTGIINSLGSWVLSSACQQSKLWISECRLDVPIMISVNVSLRQLKDDVFYDELKQLINESVLDPQYLVIEITESVMMDDPEALIVLLQKIHNLGITIALDDFGTGYSSLNYLRQMPLDILKIDQSFIDHIGKNKKDEAIVKTIIALAHNLDLQVIAEGVETKLQVDFLKQNHCNIIQGFFFSKPMPHHTATQYILNFEMDSCDTLNLVIA